MNALVTVLKYREAPPLERFSIETFTPSQRIAVRAPARERPSAGVMHEIPAITTEGARFRASAPTRASLRTFGISINRASPGNFHDVPEGGAKMNFRINHAEAMRSTPGRGRVTHRRLWMSVTDGGVGVVRLGDCVDSARRRSTPAIASAAV